MKWNAKTIIVIVIVLLFILPLFSSFFFTQNQSGVNTSFNSRLISENSLSQNVSLGPINSSIVVFAYEDFACLNCAASNGVNNTQSNTIRLSDPNWMPVVPYFKQLANEGEIRFVFKQLPITGTFSATASLASLCAAEQGKFWEFHDLVFENQTNLAPLGLKAQAIKIEGMNITKFNNCLDSQNYLNIVQTEHSTAVNSLGFNQVPTFIVNGQVFEGNVGVEEVKTALKI